MVKGIMIGRISLSSSLDSEILEEAKKRGLTTRTGD